MGTPNNAFVITVHHIALVRYIVAQLEGILRWLFFFHSSLAWRLTSTTNPLLICSELISIRLRHFLPLKKYVKINLSTQYLDIIQPVPTTVCIFVQLRDLRYYAHEKLNVVYETRTSMYLKFQRSSSQFTATLLGKRSTYTSAAMARNSWKQSFFGYK